MSRLEENQPSVSPLLNSFKLPYTVQSLFVPLEDNQVQQYSKKVAHSHLQQTLLNPVKIKHLPGTIFVADCHTVADERQSIKSA